MRGRHMITTTLTALMTVGALVVVVGSTRSTRVVTVTRSTTACPQAVWDHFADVPNRTRWDDGLEWIRLDGPFAEGSGGEVKLHDQPARRFELIQVEAPSRYTDRFFLPARAHIDFAHRVDATPTGSQVTFVVEVSGPSSLPLSLFLRSKLDKELPITVDKLVALAEHEEHC